nr:autophagy-related protein 9 [Quercus suber]
MSSRVLSRLLPVAEGDVSVYESLKLEPGHHYDVESQRGLPSGSHFHDEDDDPGALLYDDRDAERIPSASTTPERPVKRGNLEDDDVPPSLMLEPRGPSAASTVVDQRAERNDQAKTAAQLRAAQEQYGIYPRPRAGSRSAQSTRRHGKTHSQATAPRSGPRAEAMWMYTNAHNLDAFLHEVYQYYVGHGIYSIQLARLINLLTELFVVCFATFLTTCIDYSKVRSSKSTPEVLIPKCMAKAAWWKNIAIFFFIIYWLYFLAKYISETPRLLRMHDFYLHVLEINDEDIQTVSWVHVVDGLVKIQDANVSTAAPNPKAKNYLNYHQPQQRVTAETIANRLLRQTNYYVALYNKDLLDFTLPLPFLGKRQFYSKSLEWCIEFCFTNFIFDEQGSIRGFCLDVKHRRNLVTALQRRLQFAAITSVVLAPFNIVRFCLFYFFRYYTEFTRNPAKASTRSFTPWAEWKIREFNELDHLFQLRVRQAHPFANDYLNQFPKDKMDQLCRFIAFVTGAVAAVLGIASIIDNDLITRFEITPGRTGLFWIGALVFVFRLVNNMVPDENEVHNPVWHLERLLLFTHYMPSHWKDKLHSNEVRAEFSTMYQLKIQIFVEEILSIIVAPIILLRNANHHSERIIDFFRESTVHVDGIGHQCNFAVFGFKKNPNTDDPTAALKNPDGLRDDYYGLKDDKMMASMVNFANYYSHYQKGFGSRRQQAWQPPPAWPPMPPQNALPKDTNTRTDRPDAHVRGPSTKHSAVLGPTRYPKSPGLVPSGGRDRRGIIHLSESSATPRNQTLTTVSESTIMRQDSDLQDYHDGTSKTKLTNESETEDEANDDPEADAGVLGMLYQYSKKHTTAGARVNI